MKKKNHLFVAHCCTTVEKTVIVAVYKEEEEKTNKKTNKTKINTKQSCQFITTVKEMK